MNKICYPIYLINSEDPLIFSAVDIEGGHVLPLESYDLSEKLQQVLKAFIWGYSDNEILKTSPLKYCRTVFNTVNER